MKASLIETAHHIGVRLCRDAIWDGERCNWLSSINEEFGGTIQPGIGTLGACVYDGTAGIGLFLGQLFAKTGDTLFARTAAGAIQQALSRVQDIPTLVELGFYTGHFGVGYAAIQIGKKLQHNDLVQRGLDLIKQTTELKPDGHFVLDVMSGYAGTIAPLLGLYAAFGHPWLLEAANNAGHQLLIRAVRSDRGISWDTTRELASMVELMNLPENAVNELKPGCNRPHLTGLSHGSAGIAWALLELSKVNGNNDMRAAALGAIAYEDSWFNAEQEHWADLRCEHPEQSDAGAAVVTWCHGASGIGLTRLRAWELTQEPAYLKSATAALRTSARAISKNLQSQHNFSLCHGLAGDAEIFIKMAMLSNDQESAHLVKIIAEFGQAHYHQNTWPSGTETRQESPGLMLGLAGTGYFYLRIADPLNTASILLVTPQDAVF